jgi:hypothetical protein
MNGWSELLCAGTPLESEVTGESALYRPSCSAAAAARLIADVKASMRVALAGTAWQGSKTTDHPSYLNPTIYLSIR